MRCESHGLAVVAACRRNHPRHTLACQMCHEIEPTANFEGANGGVIFVFDVGLKPHFLGEQRVVNQWRRAHVCIHNLLCSFHLGQGDRLRHGCSPSQQGLEYGDIL